MESSNYDISLSSSPRFSFSSNMLIPKNFRTSSLDSLLDEGIAAKITTKPNGNDEFEFHSGKFTDMATADKLFSKGKILPSYNLTHPVQKIENISIKPERKLPPPPPFLQPRRIDNDNNTRINWIVFEDDPSPRPPKCSILLKELFKLGKRPSHLKQAFSSSSSSSSSFSSSGGSSSSSFRGRSTAEISSSRDCRERSMRYKEKNVRDSKKSERLNCSNIRIMPVGNVPINVPHRKINPFPLH
ncbi:uncharacterized protein LOC127248054 [Andrographis paniculata]|uniref:uncharacterized protein LOC127248054 n=1 Tax=Andrographis paniculata TaxID=175694 RepID=UPI0021E924B5|nr:uncharacterized protein LOC127248054 [Andrographis paniculata]